MWQKLENGLVEAAKQCGINNIQLWSGKPEDLLKRPNTYPAVRIIIENHRLEPADLFGASFESIFELSFLVFFRSLRDDATGAYSIIDRLYSLNNTFVEGYKLVPKGATLMASDSSEFIFKIDFTASSRELLHTEQTVLTRRIDFQEVER